MVRFVAAVVAQNGVLSPHWSSHFYLSIELATIWKWIDYWNAEQQETHSNWQKKIQTKKVDQRQRESE